LNKDLDKDRDQGPLMLSIYLASVYGILLLHHQEFRKR